MEEMREELKKSISELGPRGRGRPYPRGLLEKLLSYTVARRRQGLKIEEVGAEIGMSWRTLQRWLGEKRSKARFERVQVVTPTPATAAASAIVVHGPRGVRIEGLDVDGVAALVRRLEE
jgi:transposase